MHPTDQPEPAQAPTVPRSLSDADITRARRAPPRSRLFVTGLGLNMVAMTASAVAAAGSAFADRLDSKGV